MTWEYFSAPSNDSDHKLCLTWNFGRKKAPAEITTGVKPQHFNIQKTHLDKWDLNAPSTSALNSEFNNNYTWSSCICWICWEWGGEWGIHGEIGLLLGRRMSTCNYATINLSFDHIFLHLSCVQNTSPKILSNSTESSYTRWIWSNPSLRYYISVCMHKWKSKLIFFRDKIPDIIWLGWWCDRSFAKILSSSVVWKWAQKWYALLNTLLNPVDHASYVQTKM